MGKTYGENGLQMPFLSISPLNRAYHAILAILFCFSVFWAPSGRCFKVFYKVRKMGNEKIFYVFKNHQNRMKIERARRFFHFWPPGGHFLVCFNVNLDSG